MRWNFRNLMSSKVVQFIGVAPAGWTVSFHRTRLKGRPAGKWCPGNSGDTMPFLCDLGSDPNGANRRARTRREIEEGRARLRRIDRLWVFFWRCAGIVLLGSAVVLFWMAFDILSRLR